MRFGLYYVDYDDNLKRHMRSSGKWLSEFLDSKESLHKCYFEDHREKGYAPKLFDTEYLDPNNWRLSYASDIWRNCESDMIIDTIFSVNVKLQLIIYLCSLNNMDLAKKNWKNYAVCDEYKVDMVMISIYFFLCIFVFRKKIVFVSLWGHESACIHELIIKRRKLSRNVNFMCSVLFLRATPSVGCKFKILKNKK